MFKFKVPEHVTSLFIEGEAIEVKDGFIEVESIHPFLTENGFELVGQAEKADGGDNTVDRDALKQEATDLGIEFDAKISTKKLIELIEAKKAEKADGAE